MTKSELADLSVTLAGVKMRNPIGAGAMGSPLIEAERETAQNHAEMLLKHVEAGVGFICLGGTRYIPDEMLNDLKKRAKPFEFTGRRRVYRFMRMETEGLGTEGLYLAASIAGRYPEKVARRFGEYTSKIIEILKREKPQDVPIIANVGGLGAFPETWAAGAVVHEQAGVDLIEVNVSAALPANMEGAADYYFEKSFPLSTLGLLVGDQIDLVEDITRRVVQAVNIPVGVKLSPETGFPRIIQMAKRIKEAGATFINCSNSAVVIAPPDIYNRGRPRWPFLDGNPFMAGSGSWMRMIIYKQIAAIAKFVPGIDLIATGGLAAPEHIVEAMMLGARITENVTGIFYAGRGLIKRQKQFLTRYMVEQGYHSVEDFIGLGLEYIKPGEKIDFEPVKIIAEVDPLKCTGCGICTDNTCLSSYMEDGIAWVNIDDCLGCGMCVALCPEGAVTLKQKP